MFLGLLVAFAAAALFFFFMVYPAQSLAPQRAPFWGKNFAHRGLHTKDGSVPENSLAAFTAAIDEGYGIELDLRLTADEQVVVFHDDSLQRMCGEDGRVEEQSYEALSALHLLKTNQRIPLLSEVLAAADCRVPLIIELKAGPNYKALCRVSWRVLRQYDGDICVESFDPRIVRWFKRNVPGLLRGQLAAPPTHQTKGLRGYLAGWGFSNFIGRPHFIAYQKGPRPFAVRLAGRFAMQVVWTAQNEEEGARLEAEYDAVIFENYLPDPQYAAIPAQWLDEPEEDYRF